MTKTSRGVGVLLAASLVVPFWAAPASADTASEPASIGAYFYSAGIDKPEQSPAAPPNVTGDRVDGVASDHLAVAVQVPKQIDKLSFLYFDLLTVPFDATITKAVMTVPLADNGGGNTQSSPAPAKVRACAADATGFNGQDGSNTTGAPMTLCDEFSAPATASADAKSYVFDISALAATWLTGANNGVALTVAPGADASPFQVVFLPFSNATIAVEFTPSSTEIEVIPPTPDTDSFDSGSSGAVDLGTGTTGGLTGDLGGIEAAPPLVGALPTDAGAAPVSAPEVARTPVAIDRTGAATEVLSPPTSFWIGALVIAAALALLSLIMGDSRAPVAVTSQSRLSQALQSRRRGVLPLGVSPLVTRPS